MNSLNLKGKKRDNKITEELSKFLDSDTAKQFQFIQHRKIGKNMVTNENKKLFNQVIMSQNIAIEDKPIIFLQLVEHHMIPKAFTKSAPNAKIQNQLHLDFPQEFLHSEANRCIQFKLPNNVMEEYAKTEIGSTSNINVTKLNDNFGSSIFSIYMEMAKDFKIFSTNTNYIGPINTKMLTANLFTELQLAKNQQDRSVQGRDDNIAATQRKIIYLENNHLHPEKLKKAQFIELKKMTKQKLNLRRKYRISEFWE